MCILEHGLEEQGTHIREREQNKNMEKTVEEAINIQVKDDNRSYRKTGDEVEQWGQRTVRWIQSLTGLER